MATPTTPTKERPSPNLEERLTSALSRLAAFHDSASAAWEATVEVESAAERVVAHPVHVTEELMGLCMGLLEEHLPVSSRAAKAVLMLLANLCLTDENRAVANDFGLAGTCVLLLPRHRELSAETLYYVFDVMSTMTASDGRARQNLRPAIPYVLAAMKDHGTSLEVLFGASFLLHTLAMLDAANCDVIVQRGGLQSLVSAFQKAEQALTASSKKAPHMAAGRPTSSTASRPDSGSFTNALQARRQAERVQLCEGAMRWSRAALMMVCRGASAEVDVGAQLSVVDFGTFGSSIAVDELKWTLLTEQKRRPVADGREHSTQTTPQPPSG